MLNLSFHRIRGRLGALLLLSTNLGILFAFVIGEVFDYFTVSLCHLIVPLLFYVGVIFIEESPLFLIQKGRYKVSDYCTWKIPTLQNYLLGS